MLNQVILVGRIANDINVITTKSDRKVTKITLAIPRNYKNENGEYETDFIPIALWNQIAENTKEYCNKGDLIGIKGSIKSENKGIIVNAERVTFLSSKKD